MPNLKTAALWMGIFMLAFGFLGTVPILIIGDHLYGIFRINEIQNVLYIATGVSALLASRTGNKESQVYFKVIGILYSVITIIGLITGSADGFKLIPVNFANNLLHAAIAGVSIYLGFVYHKKSSSKK